jgi:hypothetical protein
MLRPAQLLMLMAALNPLLGLDLAICSPVDPATQSEFRKELTRIATRSGIEARFRDCAAASGVVRLQFLEAGSGEEPTALGAAARRHGQIGPDLRVFVGPIVRLIGTRMLYLLGVAMARVAAHELGHYLRQDDRHDPDDGGLMSASLTGPKLIAAHDFRISHF